MEVKPMFSPLATHFRVMWTPPALGVMDRTNPAGAISLITNSGVLPAMTNKAIGAQPSPAFVKKQLAPIRNIQTNPAVAGLLGVTDVKLFVSGLVQGDNRTAVKIIGGAGTLLGQEPFMEDRACIARARV
jgi:hypothetical protein